MKQKHQFILIILTISGIILISGCSTGEERHVLTENPVTINTVVSESPSSPMDITLIATQFSADKTSEITVKIGEREGYDQRITWTDVKAEIRLPKNLELIEGDPTWQGSIPINEFKEFKIRVKAIKNGEGIVQASARYATSEDSWFGDGETFYVLVKDDEILISDNSFTLTPRQRGERVYVEPVREQIEPVEPTIPVVPEEPAEIEG